MPQAVTVGVAQLELVQSAAQHQTRLCQPTLTE
eukprot:CAMPEP_0175946226 /NCGR_PEP_ID=MMETSP0108-20121206/27179_1 /TAXON_ID=195067 ORGANISM="Goniomonas pacifica, Strain CCMP1869" /NCGR_SAMPLE_ID=MMETSP0108 /ASSEMBLY_ACC=CAM_ASM_000204 /LENGTH=32 /DNA_ID= /DNA_START= /DNA_END= /DNA_ORIENTATION=